MEEDVAHEGKVSDTESQVAVMLIKVESDFESNLQNLKKKIEIFSTSPVEQPKRRGGWQRGSELEKTF